MKTAADYAQPVTALSIWLRQRFSGELGRACEAPKSERPACAGLSLDLG